MYQYRASRAYARFYFYSDTAKTDDAFRAETIQARKNTLIGSTLVVSELNEWERHGGTLYLKISRLFGHGRCAISVMRMDDSTWKESRTGHEQGREEIWSSHREWTASRCTIRERGRKRCGLLCMKLSEVEPSDEGRR